MCINYDTDISRVGITLSFVGVMRDFLANFSNMFDRKCLAKNDMFGHLSQIKSESTVQNASRSSKISCFLTCMVRNLNSLSRQENIKHKSCFWPRNYTMYATIVTIWLSLIDQASNINEWYWNSRES